MERPQPFQIDVGMIGREKGCVKPKISRTLGLQLPIFFLTASHLIGVALVEKTTVLGFLWKSESRSGEAL